MEHGPHIVEGHAYPGLSSFTHFRSTGDQQAFNIRYSK